EIRMQVCRPTVPMASEDVDDAVFHREPRQLWRQRWARGEPDTHPALRVVGRRLEVADREIGFATGSVLMNQLAFGHGDVADRGEDIGRGSDVLDSNEERSP